MKQTLTTKIKIDQSLQLHQNMITSLDYLKMDSSHIQEEIAQMLQSNPFIDGSIHYEEQDNGLENIGTKPQLKEDLYRQLVTIPPDYEMHILTYLIESLNQHGFLDDDIDTYCYNLNKPKDTLLKHISLLQSFEPIGVAAFSMIDSIKIQLLNKNHTLAATALSKHFDTVITRNYHLLAKRMNISKIKATELIEQIQNCDPYPCRDYDTSTSQLITPDVEISIEDGIIEILPYQYYDISINQELYTHVKNDTLMKQYFKEANFFLDNLTKRNQTVLMITNALVEIQKNHFLFQDELKGCTLQEIADICKFHPSTISRTLHHKHYLFQGEIFPLKHLLVSKTTTGDSSDAIKKALLEIIADEDKSHPYSDEDLKEKLAELDLTCSRRTINKYRTMLHIPTSSKRKNTG